MELIGKIPDGSIDLCVTDPPYEFSGRAHGGGMFSEKNRERYGRKREVAMLGELETLDSVRFNPSEFLDLLCPKMKRFYGYFFCNKTLVADYILWAREHGMAYDILCMAKQNPVPAHSTHHVSDLEYVILIRERGTYFKGSGLEPDDYRKLYVTNCQKRIHPAEKPVGFLERLVRVSCPENGTVIDPFMGSGSTGIACVNTGKDFIGIEKDGRYFAVAESRIKEHLGEGGLFDGNWYAE